MRTTGTKRLWQMSTKTDQNSTNAVCPTTKETNTHTERKVGATEIKVAETRITKGMGNPRGKSSGVSAIITARAVTNKKTAGRNTQN